MVGAQRGGQPLAALGQPRRIQDHRVEAAAGVREAPQHVEGVGVFHRDVRAAIALGVGLDAAGGLRVLLHREHRVTRAAQREREPPVVAEEIQRLAPGEFPRAQVVVHLIQEGPGLHVPEEVHLEAVLPLVVDKTRVARAVQHHHLTGQPLEVAARGIVPADHVGGPGQLHQDPGDPLLPGVHALGERLQRQARAVAVHEEARQQVRLAMHPPHAIPVLQGRAAGQGRLQPAAEEGLVCGLLGGGTAREQPQRQRRALRVERLADGIALGVHHGHHPPPGLTVRRLQQFGAVEPRTASAQALGALEAHSCNGETSRGHHSLQAAGGQLFIILAAKMPYLVQQRHLDLLQQLGIAGHHAREVAAVERHRAARRLRAIARLPQRRPPEEPQDRRGQGRLAGHQVRVRGNLLRRDGDAFQVLAHVLGQRLHGPGHRRAELLLGGQGRRGKILGCQRAGLVEVVLRLGPLPLALEQQAEALVRMGLPVGVLQQRGESGLRLGEAAQLEEGQGPLEGRLVVAGIPREHDGRALQGIPRLSQVIERHGRKERELDHHVRRHSGLGQPALGVEQSQLIPLPGGGQLHHVQVRGPQQGLAAPWIDRQGTGKRHLGLGDAAQFGQRHAPLGMGIGEVRLQRGRLGRTGQRCLEVTLVVVAARRLQGRDALGAADRERDHRSWAVPHGPRLER
ncbi:conserved hypothetical protein [Stigmatella aurantiaca DW4/3-1]|uniref:Uncharacterized protein n=1 Tax=Stigmatella aurantiaca (strain DW4/3-1) TaxID=378806 RepID=Q08VI3_STIAD|nr:conserved hypothetical protein [Stigmatella aurantiaca DW4/3-1]